LCLILGVLAQDTQKFVIDDFSVQSPALVIVIPNTASLPMQVFNSVIDSSILGGERNLILQANSGAVGKVFNTDVSSGSWNVAIPNGSSGITSVQYDGLDKSATLDVKGLGGLDFTNLAGTIDAFKVLITTDAAITFTISVTDINGGSSSQSINIAADPDIETNYNLLFSAFKGNVDFTKIGSVTAAIQSLNNAAASVQVLALAGPGTSGQPNPAPANPSASPAPAAATWYRFDDDDLAESFPCGEEVDENTVFLADDNIIYYYFYGFQRPYIYIYGNPVNDATLLIPSIFACIFALFAL